MLFVSSDSDSQIKKLLIIDPFNFLPTLNDLSAEIEPI